MNLYILRHGRAERPGADYPDDGARPLSRKGRRRTRRSIRGMRSQRVRAATIVSSPLSRARQTAEIVQKGLKASHGVVCCDALATGDFGGIIDETLRHAPSGDVLLVGHEPTLSALISLLSSGSDNADITLRTGGLCKLSVQELSLSDCAAMEWLLTPKQLAAMG